MNTLSLTLASLLLASSLAYNSDTITSISGDNDQPVAADRNVDEVPPPQPPPDEISIGD
ncbi:MAG TPA: hypothetical protein VFX96_09795 [Pyrinomonadaceae bacterium]|nr:hypothetical protein [Pyrinomonadaceae bacterium]